MESQWKCCSNYKKKQFAHFLGSRMCDWIAGLFGVVQEFLNKFSEYTGINLFIEFGNICFADKVHITVVVLSLLLCLNLEGSLEPCSSGSLLSEKPLQTQRKPIII